MMICRNCFSGKVSVALHHLQLFPVNKKATFQIHIDSLDNMKLAVTGPTKTNLPVQVTGNVKNGFLAEFLPQEVGPYDISIKYNNVLVGGTPFTGQAYDASKIVVLVPWGTISTSKPVEFTIDTSKAGKGDLGIAIFERGRKIPPQLRTLGSAKFAVSFVPLDGLRLL